MEAERLDERRFADAGGAGQADTQGLTAGAEVGEQGKGLLAVVGAGTFDQGDGAGEGAAVAGEDGLCGGVHVHFRPPGAGLAVAPGCVGVA